MNATQDQIVVRLTGKTAALVGDLREQIAVALSGMDLIETTPRIRARIGTGVRIDACDLWGMVGEPPVWRRLCDLPAALDLRLQLVAKAAQNAGFMVPMSDAMPRAEWRRIPNAVETWCELPLWVPGNEPDTRPPTNEERP